MESKIEITLPNELKVKLKLLQQIYGTDENRLVLKLIENEIALIGIKSQKEAKEAYETIERTVKRIYEVAGKEVLGMFAEQVEFIAIHIIEEVIGYWFTV